MQDEMDQRNLETKLESQRIMHEVQSLIKSPVFDKKIYVAPSTSRPLQKMSHKSEFTLF